MTRDRWLDVLALVSLVALAAIPRLLWVDRIGEGWHYDEAVQGIFAREILLGLDRPVFFRQFTGQEPLYFYLIAPVMAFVGDAGAFPVRLTSALIGTATVLFTWAFAREVWGRRIGWLAAAILAVSVWGLVSSRTGYRAVTLPMMEMLALAFLASAWRTGLTWRFAVGGIALGGVAYTYLASRAFPLVLLAFGIWFLVFHRPHLDRTRAWQSAVALGTAFLTFLPLGLFYIQNPGDFAGRTAAISFLSPDFNQGDPLGTLGTALLRTGEMFIIEGDPLWRFNIAERPTFVGLMALAFLAGIGICLWRAVKGDRALLRPDQPVPAPTTAPYVFLVVAIVVMLLPMTLSAEFLPYSLRAIGIQPLVMILPALAIDWVIRILWGASVGVRMRLAAAVAVVALFLVPDAISTWRGYFGTYQENLGAAIDTHTDLATAARALAILPEGQWNQVWVSADEYQHPTFAGIAPLAYPGFRWFDGRTATVLPAGGEAPVLYAWPWSARRDALEPTGEIVGTRDFTQAPGVPLYTLVGVNRAGLEQARAQATAGLTELARLGPARVLGVDTGGRLLRDVDRLPLQVTWEVDEGIGGDVALFANLVGPDGRQLAGVVSAAVPSPEWEAGLIAIDRPVILLPAGLSGDMRLEVGFFDRQTGRRLTGTDAAGQPADRVTIPLQVTRTVFPADFPASRTTTLGDLVRLAGADVRRDGDTLEVQLGWQPLAASPRPLTAFVQVLGPDGVLLAQSDQPPAAGLHPATSWIPGEAILDLHRLTLPADLRPGSRIIAGLYDPSSGARLTTAGADTVDLGPVP